MGMKALSPGWSCGSGHWLLFLARHRVLSCSDSCWSTWFSHGFFCGCRKRHMKHGCVAEPSWAWGPTVSSTPALLKCPALAFVIWPVPVPSSPGSGCGHGLFHPPGTQDLPCPAEPSQPLMLLWPLLPGFPTWSPSPKAIPCG